MEWKEIGINDFQKIDIRAFLEIVKKHRAKYPLMRPQDYGKLIFQSEFGPEHMIPGKAAARKYLLEEWEDMKKADGRGLLTEGDQNGAFGGESRGSGRSAEIPPNRYRNGALGLAEEIGGGICRFPLSACPSAEAVELLAELFVMTAQETGEVQETGRAQKTSEVQEIGGVQETREVQEIGGVQETSEVQETGEAQKKGIGGIRAKLESLDAFGIPGMEQWAASWMEQGCPPVHHSDVYREAYQPHYRLLRKEYAGYFPVLLEIREFIKRMEQKGDWEKGRKNGNKSSKKSLPVVIAIDGRCGSGKTGLARLISELFSCHVLHMDDYYLPMAERPANWMQIPGGNMDFGRFRTEALHPAASGETVFYRPYCCSTATFQKMEELPPRPLFVVEGSYSHHPLLSDAYGQKIFLTCTKQKQEERLKKREGNYFHAFEERWIPMEENYLKHYEIEQNSDFTIDTSEFYE